ncbi:XdhC family protein [Arthrobacter sp. UYEF3]|uniref:XdhC family protein n=1 Tax=Arthrobacter sp. UYEF3 TaxID=1756365 RepID=UPI00339A7C21
MLDLMPSLGQWQPAAAGQRCAVATVVGTGGSVPRPLGTSMLVSETGEVLGSLSGGCVEGAVVQAALEAMRDGGTRREFFGYSAEDAFAVGLTCGGELEVHIEPIGSPSGGLLLASLHLLTGTAAGGDPGDPGGPAPGRGVALIRRVDARGGGAVAVRDPASFQAAHSPELAALLGAAGATGGSASAGVPTGAAGSSTGSDAGALMLAAAAQLEPLLRGGRTGLVRLAPPQGYSSGSPGLEDTRPAPEPITLLVESRLPPARMLVFGANDFGAALLPAAKLLGYHVSLCDARPAFAGQERFAVADHVVTDWPHRYLAAEAALGRIDARTVVCILTHDPKFELPLLETALAMDLAYVGAMGSRRSHRQRIDSLLTAGVAAEDLARLHSPIGLDLGAVTPAEVAVSITAELVASRNRGASSAAGSLRDGSGPIHHYVTTPQLQEIPWT